VTENGVRIVGDTCLEGHFANTASMMYSANVSNFINHFWNKDSKTFSIKQDNEIIKGCLMTHGGAIVHERFAKKA